MSEVSTTAYSQYNMGVDYMAGDAGNRSGDNLNQANGHDVNHPQPTEKPVAATFNSAETGFSAEVSAGQSLDTTPPAGASSDAGNSKALPLLSGPVRIGERVASVDVLRGIALLAILVVNILAFALPDSYTKNPSPLGEATTADIITWMLTGVFFFQKGMGLFSMLFGAGLIMMYERAQNSGQNLKPIYYRRLAWLLLIGFIHSYFVWWGDILFYYAISGMLLYPFRKFSPKALIPAGIAMTLVAAIFIAGIGLFINFAHGEITQAEIAREAGEEVASSGQAWTESMSEITKSITPTEEQVAEEIELYRSGYWTIISKTFFEKIISHTFSYLFYVGWQILGMMFIGMGVYKLGIFSGAKSPRFYLMMALIGYPIGILLLGNYHINLFASGFAITEFMGPVVFINRIGLYAMLAAHVGLAMYVFKKGWFSGLMARLAAVGRMALTNYLMHTIVFTLIFYGWGLGLYGKFGQSELILFVLGMWLLQLWLSPWWLARYNFGPMEWLWRSLTYAKKQPMKAAVSK